MNTIIQMLTLLLSVTALTVMGMLWFSRKREDYEFLTVDSETGDLAIVDASSGLEALSGGGLQATGNFNVKGNLTTDGTFHTKGALTTDSTINQVTIGSGGVNGVTIGSGAVNGVTLSNTKVNGVTLSNTKVNGVTLSNNQVNATRLTGGQLCIGNTCLNEDHLKILRGEKDVSITANGGAGAIRVDGTYTEGHKLKYSKERSRSHNVWRLTGGWAN